MSWLTSLKGQISNFVLSEEELESQDSAEGGSEASGSTVPSPSPAGSDKKKKNQGLTGLSLPSSFSFLETVNKYGNEAPKYDAQRLVEHIQKQESTIQSLTNQLEEVSEARDKEALELVTLKRELAKREVREEQSTASSSESPQLPDESSHPQGVSPAISDDGFTKLDPSETELWEATQELSQSAEARLEAYKKELDRHQKLKLDWFAEKSQLENELHDLRQQFQTLQDWQGDDVENGNLNEPNKSLLKSAIETERDELVKEKTFLNKQINNLQSELSEKQKENDSLTSDLEELDNQHQEALDRILQVKDDISSKYDDLNLKYADLEKHVTKQNELHAEEVSNLQSKYENVQTDFSSLQSEYDLVLNKLALLENENLAFKQKALLDVEEEKEELGSVNELQEKISSLEAENNNLRDKLNLVESNQDSLQTELQNVLSVNENLKRGLSARKSEQSEDENANSGHTLSSETLSSVIAELKHIVDLKISDECTKYISLPSNEDEQLDSVEYLASLCNTLKKQKEVLVFGLIDQSMHLRKLKARLTHSDKMVFQLESECNKFRVNYESLLDGLNVIPDKGMLPSIPETVDESEEIESEEHKDTQQPLQQIHHAEKTSEADAIDVYETVARLENEVDMLRDARSSLDFETVRLQKELQELTARFRTAEAMVRNQENLEKELTKWREQCEKLRRVLKEMEDEKASLQEEAELARFGQDSLQAEVSEWKTIADTASEERQNAVQAQESMFAEMVALKADLGAQTEKEIENQKAICHQIEAKIEKVTNRLEFAENFLKETQFAVQKLLKRNEELENELREKDNVKAIENDQVSVSHQKALLDMEDRLQSIEQEKETFSLQLTEKIETLKNLLQEKDELQKEMLSWKNLYHNVSAEIENKKSEQSALESHAKEKETLQEEIKALNERVLKVETECGQVEEALRKSQENERILGDQLEALSTAKHALETEVKRLQDQLTAFSDSNSLTASPEGDSATLEALEKKMVSMLEEKEQILSVLAEKTRENGILRSENQKLVTAVSCQESQKDSSSNDQLFQQLSLLQSEKEQLIVAVQVKHNENLQYHAEIVRLTGVLGQVQQQIQQQVQQQVQQQIQNLQQQNTNAPQLTQSTQTTTCEDEATKKNSVSLESSVNNQEMAELQNTCVALNTNLQQEREQNTYLQNEMQEQHEKEGLLTRELERLRAHLVEVEESYTAETLRLEEQVRDLQGKLAVAEERLHSVSTAHTSASIRANQHVESLQGQSRLIGQQRDELQAKLSAAEDREQKNAAALRNLQAVLEQFQRDKERDLMSMTEKLRMELQNAHRKHSELSTELTTVKNQLTEAKEGLSAAGRLGEQLDRKSETISALKEQIGALQGQVKSAEERVRNAHQSFEGKVDKSLVKNIVVGLLTAPSNSRGPALKVVASVLDFNQDERQRVGLEHGAHHSEQSLSEAFVRFLESESRPHMQLRLLPESSSRVPARSDGRKDSRSSSTQGDSPVRQSPLLSEVVLPTLAPLPVGRNSSSILKDVLNSDNS